MGCRYSKDDLAYALPEYFSRASDIMAAISIAEEKLALMKAEESEIQLKETTMTESEEIPGQLTICNILPKKICRAVKIGTEGYSIEECFWRFGIAARIKECPNITEITNRKEIEQWLISTLETISRLCRSGFVTDATLLGTTTAS